MSASAATGRPGPGPAGPIGCPPLDPVLLIPAFPARAHPFGLGLASVEAAIPTTKRFAAPGRFATARLRCDSARPNAISTFRKEAFECPRPIHAFRRSSSSSGWSLAASLVAAASQEIPITTSSPEARQLFVQAREKAENLELQQASKLVDQAIAKDPNFAMAYALRAEIEPGLAERQKDIEKAANLAENASPGEQAFIRAWRDQIEGNATAARQDVEPPDAEVPG